MNQADKDRDARDGYEYAIKMLRVRGIYEGTIEPLDETERREAHETWAEIHMKRGQKYSHEEDMKLLHLRGSKMSWLAMSKLMPRRPESLARRYRAIMEQFDAPPPVRITRACNICGKMTLMTHRFQRFCLPCKERRVPTISQGFDL